MSYGEGNVINRRKRLASDGKIYLTVQIDTDGKEFIEKIIAPDEVKPVLVEMKDGRNATLYL